MSDHNIYLDIPECFIIFNDDQSLPFDPIGPEDLVPAKMDQSLPFSSMAWSSNCNWYFVIADFGIYLFNIDGSGWLCRKRSACFIELFLNAPKGPPVARKRSLNPVGVGRGR